MSITLSFDISDAEMKKLEEAILREIGRKLELKLNINKQKLTEKLLDYLEKIFWSNKIVKSLSSDSPLGLRADVGVAAGKMQTILQEILQALQESVNVQEFRVQKIGNDFRLTAKISMIKTNYSDLLSISGTSYESESKTGTYDIPWLKWILYNAGEFVLTTHHNIVRKPSKNSRSGLAIMVNNHSIVWRVPSWVNEVGHRNFIQVIGDEVQAKISEFVGSQL